LFTPSGQSAGVASAIIPATTPTSWSSPSVKVSSPIAPARSATSRAVCATATECLRSFSIAVSNPGARKMRPVSATSRQTSTSRVRPSRSSACSIERRAALLAYTGDDAIFRTEAANSGSLSTRPTISE
jgi:hypothetical protein